MLSLMMLVLRMMVVSSTTYFFFEKLCKYFLFNKISKLILEKFDYLAHPVHNKDNMWNLSQSVSVRTQFFIATK